MQASRLLFYDVTNLAPPTSHLILQVSVQGNRLLLHDVTNVAPPASQILGAMPATNYSSSVSIFEQHVILKIPSKQARV